MGTLGTRMKELLYLTIAYIAYRDVLYPIYKILARKIQMPEITKKDTKPKKLFMNTKILFIGKADGMWFHYGHNSWGNLEDVLMARGYSVQEVDRKLQRMSSDFYLPPEETGGHNRGYFDEVYWVMAKSLPKHMQHNPQAHWDEIKTFLDIKH